MTHRPAPPAYGPPSIQRPRGTPQTAATLKSRVEALERAILNAGGDSDHPGTGTDSMQVGLNADASGDSTVAAGVDATATEMYATSLGYGARAEATGATSIGYRTVITNSAYIGSTGVGYDADIGGQYATAVGGLANALADYTTGLGGQANAVAASSTAVGALASVPTGHNNSIALGAGATTTAAYQCMVEVTELELANTGGSHVLKSADGTRWRLSITNAGVVSVAAA